MSTITYFLSFGLIGLSFLLPILQVRPLAERQTSLQDIPDVTLHMVPVNVRPQPKHEPYRVCNKPVIKILVTNNSNSQIRVLVFDTYYQNRPQLYKDGKLLPYRTDTAKLVESKDRDPVTISITGFLLEPGATEEFAPLRLIDWYEPLLPGSYKLINRHRFAIRSAWTIDSEALLFDVLEEEC
jgi:hypothetical protein